MMVQEYRLLAAFVQRVQRGLTLRRVLQSGIVLLTVCLTLLLLGVGVQPMLGLAPLVAPLYSLLALGVVLYLGLYVVLPALRPVSLRQALSSIEAAYPDLHDDLTNALQLDPDILARSNPHGIALDLVQALHYRTARQVQQYTAPAVVRQRRLVGLPWCTLVLCLQRWACFCWWFYGAGDREARRVALGGGLRGAGDGADDRALSAGGFRLK